MGGIRWLLLERLDQSTLSEPARHLPTVDALHPNRAAMSLLDSPSAAANTIRHRNANACALFGRRAQR